MKAGVTWQLLGWGNSSTKPGRRGGMLSRYSFDTEKEALVEQKTQLKDQAWKVEQKTAETQKALQLRDLKKRKEELKRIDDRWGFDFERKFSVFKVTHELVSP